jgi:hypothetical protein
MTKVHKVLNKEGFLIYDDLYARVTVDKTEVLYYSEIVDKQVNLIAKIIKNKFPNRFHNIKPRLVDMEERREKHPRTIIIKLKTF